MKTLQNLAYVYCAIMGINLSAQSSVWQVSEGAHSVYISGTCHILRASDYPLPVEYDSAYKAADSLVFEVPPEDLNDPAFAMRLMTAGVYQDGRTLKSVLSDEAYTALAAECRQANMPIEMIQSMKPSMAVMMLTVQKLMQAGVSQAGVDLHYAQQAKVDQKPTASLETTEFQLQLITSMGEGIESEMVLYSLKDLERINELFEQMIEAWRIGNLDTIEQLFVDDMLQYPEIYNTMLKDRNARWLPQIEAMLETEPTELVLVGLAHMAGSDGLIKLLTAKGYTVTQLNAD
ncbi:TraB/GumN family protein [Coraliomargarita algicola]|uniref:TraB/GumN family protein n=1 Tax=Coraliomargarita algicola TaxID=3092156 RepID=A0ABZ0RGV4_9BACT|nr:TraB/GumN family protein [Coraliomargarita sp. J2-16]WPJ94782.1 TraB/GumN family protein [Coraliomargarita sp. J2-16]